MGHTIIALRCLKCGKKGIDKDNPKTTMEIRDRHNSYNGWLCKCGHYNGLDK